MVFEILDDNGMCCYYDFDEQVGMSFKGKKQVVFVYLDDFDVWEKFIDFVNDDQICVIFFIFVIYCVFCFWLLENFYKFNFGIQAIIVNFVKKEVYVIFDELVISFW